MLYYMILDPFSVCVCVYVCVCVCVCVFGRGERGEGNNILH